MRNLQELILSMTLSFGCYEKFYSNKLGYLTLLNLGNKEECSSLVAELKIVVGHKDWELHTIDLLRDNNWRSHLPSGLSFLLSRRDAVGVRDEIWNAVIRGSWVSPQLLVILSVSDVGFVEKIIKIALSGLLLKKDDPILLHSEMGPGNEMTRIGKILNAAVALEPRVISENRIEKIEQMIALDMDGADQIAIDWKESLEELGIL